MSKKNGTMISKDNFFFHTVKQIFVESPYIGYHGKKSFGLLSKFNDNSGRVLITEVKIENKTLLLMNLYNANTENKQLSTLSDLSNMLER